MAIGAVVVSGLSPLVALAAKVNGPGVVGGPLPRPLISRPGT
jgi:hypothetical protein